MLEYIDSNTTLAATASAFALITGSIYLMQNRNNNNLFEDLLNNLKHLNINPDNNLDNNQNNNQEDKSAKTITNFFKTIIIKSKLQDKNSLDESMLIVDNKLDTIKEGAEAEEIQKDVSSGCNI